MTTEKTLITSDKMYMSMYTVTTAIMELDTRYHERQETVASSYTILCYKLNDVVH